VRTCTDDPAAECWKKAATITRFAAPERVNEAPAEAELSLARQGNTVLVRVGSLPEGTTVEIILGKNRTGGLAEAAVLVAGEGMHRLPLGPGQLDGRIRSLSVHLREADSGLVRTWAPQGHGDLNRTGSAWFSDSETPRTIEISQDDGKLSFHAPGAAELRLVHRRAILPSGGRGISRPWSIQAKHTLSEVRSPETGWHDLTALWRGPGGGVTGLQHRVLYLRAEGAPGAEALGIHPAPKTIRPGDGAPFQVRDGTRVCTGNRTWRPIMRLARAELQRLTGHNLHSRCQLRATANSIRLVKDADLPAEGFRIRTTKDHIEIAAADQRGALYGAMAAVDGLGPDGTLVSGEIADAPAIPWRILHQRLVLDAKAKISPDSYIRFLRRAVVRGRYNTLILDLSQGYRWASHPELAKANAWTRADLERVLKEARTLGLEVLPGLAEPGHAEWITAKHPDLAEDGAGYMLCTRHPQTRALLGELMSELIDLFDQPRYLHIGHDELWWRTQRKHEVERCPRCAGSPRWQLVLDDLLWHHSWLMQRGVKPMMWSDMLVKAWHGKNGAIYRAAEGLPLEIRRDFVLVSWTRVGDSVGTLVPMDFPVVRGHTGYHDWKRVGLEKAAKGLTGEALALFYGTPWSSFGGSPGPTPLSYHWSAVILAGTTAWRPDLARTAIAPTLDHLTQTTAFLPGLRAIPGKPLPLALGPGSGAIDAVLPDSASVQGALFDLTQPVVISDGPLTLKDLGQIEGLSLLQAVDFDRATERRLIRAWRRGKSSNGTRVVQVLVTYADGQTLSTMLRLGMDTDRASRPVRAQLQWRGGGSLRVPSLAAGALHAGATDRAFTRWDWINPRPEAEIQQIRFTVVAQGVRWQVLGATAWQTEE
jgi:hypothetical protein